MKGKSLVLDATFVLDVSFSINLITPFLSLDLKTKATKTFVFTLYY